MAEMDNEFRESFSKQVAGGTALNLLAGGTRISRDIAIFHGTNAALEAAGAAGAFVFHEGSIRGAFPALSEG